MMKKGFLIATACLVLMIGLMAGSVVSVGAMQYTGTATYDYYVVAGVGVVPTPPAPSGSPGGFVFSGTPAVSNFGNITYAGSQYYPTWLYYTDGVKVNITNALGYGITIRNLTAEVTTGTPTIDFTHPGSGKHYGNFTLVGFEALDIGNDECDYNTGTMGPFIGDQDEYVKAVGTVYPAAFGAWVGPMSLVLPDSGGDAAATGHVAPVALANGATFTEYFGARIFGNATVGTLISGTIRLTLTYEYTTTGVPVPSFDWVPSDPRVNETVAFDASLSYDPDGTITSYLWDFGDGTNDTGIIVNHTYASAGQYRVTLTVIDNDAKSNYEEQTVIARILGAPVADFSISPESSIVDQTVAFDASSSYDPDGTITSYLWDFGDGTNDTDIIIDHTYPSPQNYNITLTVIDNASLTDTTWKLLTVRGYPWASFTYSPAAPRVDEMVTFNASLSTPEGGTIVSYTWDFGDGNVTTVTDSVITHSFASAETFNVILNVTDSEGLSDTESNSITVVAQEFPWLWVGVAAGVILLVIAAIIFGRKRVTKGVVLFALFMVATQSVAVAATFYVGPQARISPTVAYSEGAQEYMDKSEKLVDLWLKMGTPFNVAPKAAATCKERAETNASATDGVVNTNDLRYAITYRFVERGTVANIDEAYATLCLAEKRLGIEFGTEPWTDAEDWGHLCP